MDSKFDYEAQVELPQQTYIINYFQLFNKYFPDLEIRNIIEHNLITPNSNNLQIYNSSTYLSNELTDVVIS